ncbi:hypothetical protein [Streptomyces sp. NBC_00316]|uniref:hypothetical protein n=1 Tax=Streptomyces sp. NBC_00316 TaxID=2975710 RepID=UPI003FA74FC4
MSGLFQKWRKARRTVGMPDSFRFYLRHTGHTLSTQSGATLKDTMVRAGQSSERAARLIYQHSNLERQREVADGIDARVRAEREKAAIVPDDQASGTERAGDA